MSVGTSGAASVEIRNTGNGNTNNQGYTTFSNLRGGIAGTSGEFSGSGMRDIQKIAWQTADTEGEYDQFVGASITPRAVANRVYDVLVFFQSNRILLLQEAQRAI